MRVLILRSFWTDEPTGRVRRQAGAVESPDDSTGLLWCQKGLARKEGAEQPAITPVAHVSEMPWPELRQMASGLTEEPIRSRAQAERVVTEHNPDAA